MNDFLNYNNLPITECKITGFHFQQFWISIHKWERQISQSKRTYFQNPNMSPILIVITQSLAYKKYKINTAMFCGKV